MNKLIIPFYILILISLFLYSFTQVDLSLVLNSHPAVFGFQKFFQHIGYFNRPLSTGIYLAIIITLLLFYLYLLRCALKNKLSLRTVWTLIITSAVMLTLSYNAFSYDLFNYIFDAKIVSFYTDNPYTQKALDYTNDPMLSFMRWTHRVYPYGPIWLALTVPLSYLGLQIFTLTFGLFKLLMAASFVGSALMVGKIFKKVSPKDEVFGLIFFALNPLIIIESLVSSHIDIVMVFFALLAFYLLISQKFITSWFSLLVSIGIKFATVFLLPVFILKTFFDKKNKYSWDQMFYLSTILMGMTIFAASYQSGNFQPWYLIPFLAFATFVGKRPIIFITVMIGSFFSLLNYVPNLYLGVFDKRLPELISTINIVGLGLIIICSIAYILINPKKAT